MAYKGLLCIASYSAEAEAAYAAGLSKNSYGKKAITMVECQYQFHREVSEYGFPKDGVTGGRIIATIITPQQSTFFFKWLFEEKMENGWVEINNSQNEPHYIFFERARCVDIYEYFNNQSKHMMTTRLTIQCPEMGFFDTHGDSFAYNFRTQKSRPISGGNFADHAFSATDNFKEGMDALMFNIN